MAADMENVLIVEQLAYKQEQQAQDDQVIVAIIKRRNRIRGRKEGSGDARSDLG